MSRYFTTAVLLSLLFPPLSSAAVDLQPLAAQAHRVIETMDHLGAPLPAEDRQAIEAAAKSDDAAKGVEEIQRALDKHCLLLVSINPESRVKVARGPAKAELLEDGYRTFLLKVVNDAGVTAELHIDSPNGGWLAGTPKNEVNQRWLGIEPYVAQPMAKELSGLGVEYRVVSLYSRDPGQREAKISCNVGQGTQDLGFRNDVDVLFSIKPSNEVTLGVHDEQGDPTTAAFEIRDDANRVYPSQAKRLAPDFAFQPQVYRGDRQTVKLPAGQYSFTVTRGPEYVAERRKVTIADGQAPEEKFDLKRWIDPAKQGWFSGDHHIHAAGCAHYTKPTEGVLPEDMIRHCLGEDLKVGCNLTWGPCFDYQKQFFTGQIDKVSRFPYLLRYDVEVSGFGSHQSGHLVLLRLKDEIYPGGDSDKHWPTLCLNTLKWAKAQGAVCGPAHSGWGLQARTDDLPNYLIPPYDGIGANEYIADVTNEVPGPDGKLVPAVDFMSMVDTPSIWELNMWYHTLNCGYRTRISGETDFPCIYGQRVGIGRSYVKLDKLSFDAWCDGVRDGRCYVSDGMSHLIDFKANDVALGENGSELRLPAAARVHLTVKVAARLNEQPDHGVHDRPYDQQPYWHLERARLGDTRKVPVEVIVNGKPVAHQEIEADGAQRDLAFDVTIDRSSWVALRILKSSHTNPIFALVDGKPIRASKKSAEWCLKGVDQCWSQKRRFIKADELEDAKAAYDHARQAYQKIVAECDVD